METIVFDIETGPLPTEELEGLLPAFDPAEVKTGNIKDPGKIAAKIAEAEINHRQQFFDRAALDPLTGRVVAIGLMKCAPHPCPLPSAERESDAGNAEFRVIAGEDEGVLLREFWSVCLGEMGRVNELIGFNSHLFDLPFLVRRSWRHGLKVPTGIWRGRRWSEQLVDLREAWQLGDRQARGSLDAIARHLGVGAKLAAPVAEGESPRRILCGKDFALWWETDREKAIEYLRNDVEMTARVAERLGVLGQAEVRV